MMFGQGFSGNVYHGEAVTCEADGFTVTATIHNDNDADAPWDGEDGHGPVTGWERRAKEPGELVLSGDGRGSMGMDLARRFYDFAEACRIARRDGWGFAPQPLVTKRNSGGLWAAWFGSDDGRQVERFMARPFTYDGVVSGYETESEAVSALYAAHRSSMTPRKYASRAALADFERLRRWCTDQWNYVGVAVTVSRNGIELVDRYAHATWGIESDAPEHLTETARELADESIAAARENIAALCA